MKEFGNLHFVILLLFSFIFTHFTFNQSGESSLKPIGYGYKNSQSKAIGEILNFSLLDHNGVYQELYRQTDVDNILIVSGDVNCESFEDLINNLAKIQNSKIRVFVVSINDHSFRPFMTSLSNQLNSQISILIDSSHVVSNELGFKKSGDYILIAKNEWKKVIRGNIINNPNAINEKLSKLNINFKIAITKKSCDLIIRSISEQISYEEKIAPIFSSKCLNCHSKTGSIPPYFDSYEKIKNWKQMSKETLLTGRMPPVSFDPIFGNYANDITLTDDEKFLLVNWYNQGSPRNGNRDPIKDFSPKEPPKVNPDDYLYSVEMATPHKIPPGGEIEYKYFQLGGPVPFDMWIKGYKTISSNPRQLHHESLMITSKPLSFYESLANKLFQRDQKEDEISKNTDGDIFIFTLRALEKYEHKYANDTYLRVQTWGAGRREVNVYPKKIGAFIPKGSYLILETHYMGTGRTEYEKSKIEFYGSKVKPKKMNPIHSYSLVNSNFEVPPNVKNYEVKSPIWSPNRDIYLITFLGHLHMRGKSVRLDLISENGERRTLISIPNFYYGWQTGSSLRPNEPIYVKSTDQLQTICYYDNSEHNPFNPDPNKKVKFGQRVDRTEMCKMNFGYIYK